MPLADRHRPRPRSQGSVRVLTVALLGISLLTTPASAEPSDASPEALQRTVDSLRARLGITRAITVSVVPSNPKALSVAPPATPDQAFTLEIEAPFLALLDEDEVTAALAHELGHVWVATNRPFLQTERLANDVAMRVVTRWSLVRVYRKMAAHTGLIVDEAAFLGPEILTVTRRSTAD